MDRTNKLILINIVPVLLLLITISDLYASIFTPEYFAFGPDNLDKNNAMQQWQSVTIAFYMLATLSLAGMIYMSTKDKWKWYFSCLFVFIVLVIIGYMGSPTP